ncbi:GNAT family N-acetyltransferase [Lentzea tibetensis]|uniref:GNAT family N-acetyltransferase n=1 Tax=Lentzea tibetensis TaxID=2591470 RepID=A0A563EJN5_9PSEU|nr:GNAT family N-acetyltransferase [Lentzea tibetensis]TWP47231.1 GNAT family N-acetyltransferase [Lentzea tibetensis]
MEAIVHTDRKLFAALVRDRFAEDPVLHTIAISVLNRYVDHPRDGDPELVMVTLHENDELVGSLLRTPPWHVQLTDWPVEAVDLAIDLLRRIDPELPGAIGPSGTAEAFATRWTDQAQVNILERLYRLEELEAPDAPGTFRMAGEDDVPLLAGWRHDFYAEALPSEPQTASGEEIIRSSLALGYGNALWERDGTPVAWATAGPPNNGMSRVGPVYTPPEHRRHGYGAAVTAAVSRWALDAGAEHVVLFADLLNPVSNSIYQRIGYRPVCDWTDYRW